MSVDLTLEEGWDHLNEIINNLEKYSLKASRTELRDTARDISLDVKKGIEGQSFGHTPLSPKYLAWKRRHKLDERILISTRTYIASLLRRNDPSDFFAQTSPDVVVVGPPDDIHQPSGLNLRDLALIHEFGSFSRGIPARPHWTPTFQKHVSPESFVGKMKRIGLRVFRWLRNWGTRK